MSNISYWEETIRDASPAFKRWFSKEKETLNQVIVSGSKVLDVGCGDGRSIFDILDITQDIVGVDHDSNAVSVAQKNFSKYPSISIIQAEAAKLPFDDKAFDFVICMGSFTNFGDDKIAALKEMKRVLKESGKMIVSAYSDDALEERIKLYERVKAPIIERRGTTFIFDFELGDNISEQFTEQQLRDLFIQAGLKIEKIIKVGIGYICQLTKEQH